MKPAYLHLIFFLSFILLVSIDVHSKDEPRAIDGVLDLREYEFIEEGVLDIKGEWQFFWNELIEPHSTDRYEGVFVPVPSAWQKYRELIPEIEPKGYASYVLKILLPPGDDHFAIGFDAVSSSSGYYVDGRHVGYNGLPSTNRYQSILSLRPSTFYIQTNENEIELLVHVSNYEHRSGGIRGSVKIGTSALVSKELSKKNFNNSFLFGAFLVIALLFFAQIFHRNERVNRYFALICFFMSVRILLTGEMNLSFLEFLSGSALLRLQYESFVFLPPLFLLLIRNLFIYEFPLLLFRFLMWVCLGMIVLCILAPTSLYLMVIPYYMIFVVVSSVVVFTVMIRAWRRGRSFAPQFTLGISILLVGMLNDMLFLNDVIHTGLISQYTMFVYLIIYSGLLNSRFTRILSQTETLASEIKSMNQNLETTVAKRTSELEMQSGALLIQRTELEKSNKRLQKLVNVRNKFFTIISHDIKGPVGANTQMLELLTSEKFSEAEQGEMLALLLESSRSTQSLVENLLFWGKAQDEDFSPQFEAVNVLEIVSEIKDLFLLETREKGITIELSVAPSLEVIMDRQHLHLILRNLIGNSVKFTNRNGVIRVESNELNEDKSGLVEIRVQDTGIGIPRVMIEKLFSEDEYYSTKGTKDESGTGLGLKLCKEIVEANHGQIAIKSKTGEGTCVSLQLRYG